MVNVYLFQSYVCLAIFHCCHKAPTLALSLKFLTTRFKVGIKFRQTFPEVIYATLKVLVGYKQILLYILLFYFISSLASKDYKLANNICSAEVDTWVRFAVSLLLCSADSLREWNISRNLIEYEVQCAAKHSLNLKNLIA